MKKQELILALETGIEGGSVSLIEGRREISGWIGESGLTGAEQILEAIQSVLETSKVTLEQVERILISEGPGSYTGLRIGHSTAKGLKFASGIKIRSVNLLEEMLRAAPPKTLTALPFGKGEICWGGKESVFERDGIGILPQLNFCRRNDLIDVINSQKPDNLFLSEKFYRELDIGKFTDDKNIKVIFCERSYARIIGLSLEKGKKDENLRIIYPGRSGIK
jgi:tRNA threonylcarbamoyl adenosine modification protein YeaZ